MILEYAKSGYNEDGSWGQWHVPSLQSGLNDLRLLQQCDKIWFISIGYSPIRRFVVVQREKLENSSEYGKWGDLKWLPKSRT